MNIGVIGGGSLGLLISNYFARKQPVTIYVRRKEQLDHIKSNGISLKHLDTVKTVRVDVSLIDELLEHDVYFVCVKQPHMDQLLPYLKKLNEQCKIVFLQNGMGHLHKISTLRSQIYVGVVEHGAHRTSDFEVNHLGVGTIKIAPFHNVTTRSWNQLNALNQSDFPIEIYEDWEPLLKTKLLINSVINPLTALFNVNNGAILTNKHINKLAKKLTDESAFVLNYDRHWAWENVERVARNTKDNTSSMRADILNNRETENEAISGYLLQQIDEREIPYTAFVYEAILALEERGK